MTLGIVDVGSCIYLLLRRFTRPVRLIYHGDRMMEYSVATNNLSMKEPSWNKQKLYRNRQTANMDNDNIYRQQLGIIIIQQARRHVHISY